MRNQSAGIQNDKNRPKLIRTIIQSRKVLFSKIVHVEPGLELLTINDRGVFHVTREKQHSAIKIHKIQNYIWNLLNLEKTSDTTESQNGSPDKNKLALTTGPS